MGCDTMDCFCQSYDFVGRRERCDGGSYNFKSGKRSNHHHDQHYLQPPTDGVHRLNIVDCQPSTSSSMMTNGHAGSQRTATNRLS